MTVSKPDTSERPETPETPNRPCPSAAPALRSDTAAWLGQPALRRLWDAAHHRLQSNGVRTTGSLRLTEITVEERQAISHLLVAPVPVRDGAARIRLDRLDAALRASAAGRGLPEVLAALGRPVTDLAGERRASRDAWSEVWTTADAAAARLARGDRESAVDPRSSFDSAPAVDPVPAGWASVWLDAVRRSGSLRRYGPEGAAVLLRQAVDTLIALRVRPGGSDGPGGIGRGELAERVTGTAHGLDDGAVLARLVLRALALADGRDPVAATRDAAGRRALWRSAGVVVDEVSSTALTYGLRPAGSGWRERALRERADHAQETHLTLREVAAIDWAVAPGTEVRVCENPRVVEAAATRAAPVALVCAAGNPSTVVLDLLGRLWAGGAALAYHGDFDWPGITLANRMVTRFGARPWRMAAEDYERAVEICRARATPALPLAGAPAEAVWDAELAPAMTALGVAVHEESVLETLLADLVQPLAAR